MTTKRGKSEQSSTEAATSLREESLVGLTEAELETLKRLLKDLLYTGKTTTLESLTIQSILRKMKRSFRFSDESLKDLNNPQQFRELKQELQYLRKRVNELEDELEVGETLL